LGLFGCQKIQTQTASKTMFAAVPEKKLNECLKEDTIY